MSAHEADGIAGALLKALPEQARQLAIERKLEKGQLLFGRGDTPRNMYCVLGGEIHLQRTSPSGGLLVLQRVRDGFVSEASLYQTSYHCDAVAIARTRILAFPIDVFREGLRQDDFRDRWLRHLGGELRRARTQAERLGLHTARERIIHYVETEGRDGEIQLGFSVKAWASELGIAHEVLYRTLKAMKANGEVTVEGGRVRLASGRD